MPHWSEVFSVFDDVARADHEIVRRRRLAAQARKSFEDWCQRADDQVMRQLHAELERRSAEVEKAFGVRVEVELPAEGRLDTPAGDRMRFLRMGFGGAEVFVYSSRSVRGLPSLHVAHAVRSSRSRYPRMLTVPGYVVVRGPGGEVGLRETARPATGPATTIDDVACRVLDMLASAALALRAPKVA